MPMFGSPHLLAHAKGGIASVPVPLDMGVWYKGDDGPTNQVSAQFVAGASEYLSIPTNSSLRFSPGGSWTIGGWLYLDVGGGIMLSKTDLVNAIDWQFHTSGGLTLQVQIGAGYPGLVVASPAPSAWHFVVGSYDAAAGGVLSIQINNGGLTSSAPLGGPVRDSATGGVMAGANTWNAPGGFLSGRLQNWFMFDKLLTSTERTFLYNSGNGRRIEELDTAIKTGLRSWWPFNEISGSRRDLSGNGNTLTDNNTVASAPGLVWNQPVHNGAVERWTDFSLNAFHAHNGGTAPLLQIGERNGLPVLRFDGVNNTLATSAFLGSYLAGPQAQTVFVVMKQSSLDGESTLYRWDSSGGDTNVLSGHFGWATNIFYWYTGAAVGAADGNMNGAEPSGWRDTWHILECVRGGASGSIFVEGVLVSAGYSINLTGTFNNTGTQYLRISGDERTGRFYMGDMAELIIYNRTLSAAERQAVRNYLKAKWGFA